MVATLPDLLRLLVIPVFGWAAWRDIHTRRIPNRVWPPLVILGGLLLAWEAVQFVVFGTSGGQAFLIRAGISLLFVAPLGYAFWWFGAFGAADAKAMIALAFLLPTFPTYALGGLELPVVDTTIGVFSLTILTNAVILAVAAPVGLGLGNLRRRRIEPAVQKAQARRGCHPGQPEHGREHAERRDDDDDSPPRVERVPERCELLQFCASS